MKSYKQYGRCGDVDAAEGCSESVARVLVDKWDSLPRLAQLAKQDAGFRDFVLGHVDATLDMEDVRIIKTNAENRCPAGMRALCADFAKQADTALEEDAAAHRKK